MNSQINTARVNKLAELLRKNQKQPATATPAPTVIEVTAPSSTPTSETQTQAVGKNGELITYNAQQLKFIQTKGSCVLIGAAGTGKTTSIRGKIEDLISSGEAGVFTCTDDHKWLVAGTPGIVMVSYTRIAVKNLKQAVSEDLKSNCMTIHKLLEYSPIVYEVTDEEGNVKNTMRFEPTRNSRRPLPVDLKIIIIDEASMVSVELFSQLKSALPHDVTYIFTGDINQLPPVFGSAVLGYKMLELPVIELTQVYRQALESPIIRLAHRILSGKEISASEYSNWKEEAKLTLHPWKKKLGADIALLTAAKFLTTAMDLGKYDPEEDMILCPYNKAFGTIELNKHIANYIAKKQGKTVYEVIAGFNTHYFSVGDKVLVDKEEAVITAIKTNFKYAGKRFKSPSKDMDYWGCNNTGAKDLYESDSESDSYIDIDLMLDAMAVNEDKVNSASHIITCKLLDSETEVVLDTAAEINAMLMNYSLTVHKAQGSEWRKVFVLLHQSHATMTQRELLYTAVTRAREELYVICEPETFTKGILNQRIKGNTLAEKAEYFKGKIDSKLVNSDE